MSWVADATRSSLSPEVVQVSNVPLRTRSDRFGSAAFAFHLWSVFALSISNVMQVVSIIAVPFAYRERTRLQAPSKLREFSGILQPLGFLVAATGLSIALSIDPGASLKEASGLLSLITLPLALFWIRDRVRVRLILDGVVVSAAICAVWGLAQFGAGYGDLGQRIRGPFSHYMTFAGVLLLADVVLVARFAYRKPRWVEWRWPACALISAALVGSLTRSAWVALIAALIALVLLRRPRSPLVWAPALILIAALAFSPVRSRLASIVDLQNPSNYDRLSMLEAGINMAKERPLFGLGPGMARALYPIYRPLAAPRHTVQHLHNTYLQLAADRGLVGLSAYLWLFGAAGLAAFRGYRRERMAEERRNREDEEVYLACLLGLVAFSVAALFEANWLDTEVQRIVVWLLAVPFIVQSIAKSDLEVVKK